MICPTPTGEVRSRPWGLATSHTPGFFFGPICVPDLEVVFIGGRWPDGRQVMLDALRMPAMSRGRACPFQVGIPRAGARSSRGRAIYRRRSGVGASPFITHLDTLRKHAARSSIVRVHSKTKYSVDRSSSQWYNLSAARGVHDGSARREEFPCEASDKCAPRMLSRLTTTSLPT